MQPSHATSDRTLTSKLKEYAEYLDDYELCRLERLQKNAMKKFCNIMKSIKSKYRDRYQLDDDDDEDNEDDWFQFGTRAPVEPSMTKFHATNDQKMTSTKLTDFPNFNKILRRHRNRLVRQHISLEKTMQQQPQT